MTQPPVVIHPAVTAAGDDERALLIRFERLLEREEAAIVAHDAAALAAIAAERQQLTEHLGDAARRRRAGPELDASAEAELLRLYRHVREQHDVRARIVRRHGERNSRAIGVLAQAAGEASVYKADGTVALQFGAI